MTIDVSLQAINAYKSAKNMPAVNSTDSGKNNVNLFSSFLKQNIQDTVSSLREADNIAVKAAQGKADVTNVVLAFAEAEKKVNMIATVKQSLLNAYNDIIKMPI